MANDAEHNATIKQGQITMAQHYSQQIKNAANLFLFRSNENNWERIIGERSRVASAAVTGCRLHLIRVAGGKNPDVYLAFTDEIDAAVAALAELDKNRAADTLKAFDAINEQNARPMVTRDMKADLLERMDELKTMSGDKLATAVDYLVNCLKSNTVRVTVDNPAPRSPVPAYNAETDGDYSAWLASNNID